MTRLKTLLAVAFVVGMPLTSSAQQTNADGFDHSYLAYESVLREHVVVARVDYAKLLSNRAALDAVVEEIGTATTPQLERWSEEQQIAYWLNAYNAFTLQAIVDHYPIDGGWLSFLRWAPRNSIKQIDGVWSKRRWMVGGLEMTLDEIEHERLRTHYTEPRIHFALNCASISCAQLSRKPYIGSQLDRQLVLAARDFLGTERGLQVDGNTLRISSVLDWFGDDFIAQYSTLVDGGSAKDRALLGVIAKYGPTEASQLAQSGNARIRFLSYDWSLNDLEGT